MDAGTKPDIVLIVLDTLRADRLSCYGYPRETSPHIDAFAESGVLFEQAISPAQWTIPSHASIFTGEYPTTHLTTQIYDKHDKAQVMLAELLRDAGYQTVGFCNNPLLGVVENGLDRGFEELYNYGGALPNRPHVTESRPARMGRIAQRVSRVVRRLAVPIQDVFAHNDVLLRIALNPVIAPLWQRHVNFKGNTALSLRDAVGFLRTRQRKGRERPLFMFINLMETHLPFGPRARFIRKFAPYYWQDRAARRFMQSYNHSPYRWMAPITEPLSELEDRVLNDLYDAEVAYEDALLRHLLMYLDEAAVRDNTMAIITSDHGEGLNRHQFVGHTLVAYDDLVRVPLIVRYPRLSLANERLSTPVSTRRIFHTALQAAGVQIPTHLAGSDDMLGGGEALSLSHSLAGADPEAGVVFTEAYTPETLITLMKNQNPELIDLFRCTLMRRAAYRGGYKLITVGDQPDELFDVTRDPGELNNLIANEPGVAGEMDALVREFLAAAEKRRPCNVEAAQLALGEEMIADRLRGLGYIE